MNKHTPGPWVADHITVINSDRKIIGRVYDDPSFKDGEVEANHRLITTAPELLEELRAAHKIIQNALNIMTTEQQKAWSDKNELDGIKDGWAVTRENARRLIIAKAEGAEGNEFTYYYPGDLHGN